MIQLSLRLTRSVIFGMGLMLFASTSFAFINSEGIQVYQKNLHLSAEHKQKLADDITRYRNAENIWDVLREEFTLHHYEDNPIVQDKIEWYMNNQEFLIRAASRSAPYLYYILQQVRKRHLPAELVLLPIIESGYNPFAISNMGATGIWQMMPDTATGLGIKQDSLYDGRRDIIASTRGALNYLSYLISFFEGNWLLAIAAYNTGEGNVLAAIKRNIHVGRRTDFWSLPVAQQTKDYVPSLLALAAIISHPDQYPVYFPPVRNAPYLAQVDVGTQINLKRASLLAGITYNKLIQLNPGFNPTSKKGPYKLVLPIENVEQFSENLARSPLNHDINWIHYKVKSGDTLASIAKHHGVTIDEIRKMNHLSNSNLRPDINLLIPNQKSKKSTTGQIIELASKQSKKVKGFLSQSHKKIITRIQSNKNQKKYVLQPGDTIYMVRSKDTLSGIAKKFHINTQQLLTINDLNGKTLMPGTQLIVPTHAVSNSSEFKKLEPGDTIYMVRKGDTLEKIAHKFRTTPAAIRVSNLMDRNALQEGERLIIPTHMSG